MSKILIAVCTGGLILLILTAWAASPGNISPGSRTLVLAHNAYPERGQHADRLERAIATGLPFAVEIDLVWGVNPKTGRPQSFVAHNAKALTGDEPDLETLFFARVRPIVEKAFKENNRKDWPLVTLYLDIKNDPPEHLEYVWNVLGEHETWLTTAVKTNNAAKMAPLDVKPLIVLVEDKTKDIKEDYFYRRLSAGSKLRAFGTAQQTLPPGEGLTKKQVEELQNQMKAEELVTVRANNYRRWWGNSWARVEDYGRTPAGEFTPEAEARLQAIVNHAHRMGYLVSFYCLDGFEADQGKAQGWDDEYNFGSISKAIIRWKAAVKAGVDFIATDQYEEVAKVARNRH